MVIGRLIKKYWLFMTTIRTIRPAADAAMSCPPFIVELPSRFTLGAVHLVWLATILTSATAASVSSVSCYLPTTAVNPRGYIF